MSKKNTLFGHDIKKKYDQNTFTCSSIPPTVYLSDVFFCDSQTMIWDVINVSHTHTKKRYINIHDEGEFMRIQRISISISMQHATY